MLESKIEERIRILAERLEARSHRVSFNSIKRDLEKIVAQELKLRETETLKSILEVIENIKYCYGGENCRCESQRKQWIKKKNYI